MKNRLIIPVALAALVGCADNTPTEPLPRVPGLQPLLGAFPGTNGKIVFYSNRFSDGSMLTMQLGDPAVQTLSADGSAAQWSPDGSRIVFDSNVDGNPEIYVMNADGSGRTRLTNSPSFDGWASWSPDGSKIAFTSERDGPLHIYVMDANGDNVVAITNNLGGNNSGPSWSPNGNKIAFTSSRDAGNLEIYVMDANGANPTNLTNDAQSDYDPSWSPDGSKILFTRQGSNPGDFADVYVMNADGSGPTNLTANTATSAEFTAAWSPDGSRILFVSGRTGNAEIYVMGTDGSGVQNISNNPAEDLLPDWQPLPANPPVCVFGPQTYTRTQGPPARIVENFSATPGSYSVDLDDLATSGADAVVTLNGVVIMEGRGTTGEVGPRHKVVSVTLLANNVLQVDLRGKKGSKLQVKICSTSVTQCYPDLEAPQLSLESTSTNTFGNVQFELDVANYAQFPADMFVASPDLPACGSNTSAARTWVDIFDGNDNYLFGFCALYDPAALNDIWFATPPEQRPAEAYIKLTDRRCNITYTSNRISLAGGL